MVECFVTLFRIVWMMNDLENCTISLFGWSEIRKKWYDEEWWFVIVDVVAVLTWSKNPKGYLKDLKRRDVLLAKGWGQIATPLSVSTKWWNQKLNCSNTKGILRVIQSIPSPRAEPFKLWLAKIWWERINEINNPSLSMERMIDTYKKKGYPKEWIDLRTRGVSVRKDLTDEWKNRWGKRSYGVLTNEIYQAYTGMKTKERKVLKWINEGNLRDGMTPTELILTMLAEQATTDITTARDVEWLSELKKASKDWGGVALSARRELTKQTWKDPVSDRNYIDEISFIPPKNSSNNPTKLA